MTLYLIFGVILLFVILDAVADATRDEKKKLSHLFQALFVLCALSLAIVYQGEGWRAHVIFVSWYMANRFFLFDLIYNSVRKLPLDYIGRTSWWDTIIYDILIKLRMPPFFFVFIKFVIWFSINGAILHPDGALYEYIYYGI